MDSNAWLNELKEGDPIIIEFDEGFPRETVRRVTNVARVTPTGIVKVWNEKGDDVLDFGKTGRRCEGTQWHHTYYNLVPYRPELMAAEMERRERKAIIYRMEKIAWRECTLDQLRRIAAILDEKEEKE